MTLFARGLPVLALLALGLSSESVLGSEQSDRCDCGCGSYQVLISLIESSPTSAASHVDQCGGACANRWTRCEQALAMQEDAPTEPVDAQAGPVAQLSDQQATLHELLERFLRGATTGDVAMHDRFWSENLVYTSSSGQRYGKAELMEGLASSQNGSGPGPVYSADQLRIRLYDQLALIDFVLVATDTDSSQQRFLNSGVLKDEDGQWRAVNWHATRKSGD